MPGATVVIVEDAATCATTLEMAFLGIPDIDVTVLPSAQEALRLLEGENCAVGAVVTDLNMPRMDGFEFIERIRAEPRHRRLPIIVVSGDTDPGTPGRLAALGANAFFPKPYSPAQVRLKLEQRKDALKRGIRLIEWTFDPLEIKNAFLNIHKLGAVVRSYFEDFYGVSSSRLQAGLPTDRLLAEWRLDSPHVLAILEGGAKNSLVVEEVIQVPATIYEWKASEAERERALAILMENRQKFLEAFSRGLAVIGFVRDADGNGSFELGHPTQLELN